MLLPAHLGASYLAGVTLLSQRGKIINRANQNRILFYGLICGMLADADFIALLLRTGWSALGDAAGQHRASVLHTPVFVSFLALLPLSLPVANRTVWAAVGGVTSALHLVLDSLTIGPGVMWMYPLNTTFYGLNVATVWYRRQWGDQWLVHYMGHPLFAIEVVILVAAAAVYWKRRNGRHASNFT